MQLAKEAMKIKMITQSHDNKVPIPNDSSPQHKIKDKEQVRMLLGETERISLIKNKDGGIS